MHMVKNRIPPRWANPSFSLKIILKNKAVIKGETANIVIMIEKLTPA